MDPTLFQFRVSLNSRLWRALKGAPGHSIEIREATKTIEGRQGLIAATKAMALSAVELILDKQLLRKVKAAHK